MRFYPRKPLRLVSLRTIEKGERKFTFVKLADEETFENNDFMLNGDVSLDSLLVPERYDVVMDVDGKFSTVTLTPVPKK